MAYLGIDLGTSGLRALLVGEDGVPLGSAERHYSVSNPHPGWSEQDPADWIEALEGAVADLRAAHPAFTGLKGIGVSGHMHGATLLDDKGDVLRPCILWNDTRSAVEAADLDAQERVRALSGNIVFPGFTAPKLLWVQKHEPEVFKRLFKVLLPAAYLNHYLTGEYVADMSDSAGTSWLDAGKRAWSDELLSAGGLDEAHMPRLVEGSEAAAPLRSDLAAKWGVTGAPVVAGGAGDNAAAACGIGALKEGQGFVSLGTSGVVLLARDSYAPDPGTAVHTFCHAVPNRWYQMSVMLSATDCLNWLAKVCGSKPSDLTAELGPNLKAPSDVTFLPYLSGERTPHNDAQIRAGFAGLAMPSERADLTQAVLEGVSFGLRDGFEALKATGARADRLMAIGGGSASAYWLELLATVLNTPLDLPDGSEFGAALGAARLGQLAATGADLETVLTPPKIKSTVTPNADLVAAFDTRYQHFRAAYAPLKEMQGLA